MDPECDDAYYNRGVVYLSIDRYEEAVADFTASLDLYSDFPTAHLLREKALVGLGRYEQA